MLLDVVDRAIIIGPFTWPYEFWTRDGKTKITDRRLFESDEQAEAWFKENYPIEYKRGVEMRRYN